MQQRTLCRVARHQVCTLICAVSTLVNRRSHALLRLLRHMLADTSEHLCDFNSILEYRAIKLVDLNC